MYCMTVYTVNVSFLPKEGELKDVLGRCFPDIFTSYSCFGKIDLLAAMPFELEWILLTIILGWTDARSR